MPRQVDRRSTRLGVAAVACCILCGACSRPDSEPGDRPSFSEFAGFMLANVLATEERDPADAASAGGAPAGSPELAPTLAAEEPGPPIDEEPTTCEVPYNGQVTIVTVRNPAALVRAMTDRGPIPIVYSTEDTTIYEDGRVLTWNVEAVGDHLNAVGWASNSMRILGAGTIPANQFASSGWSKRSNSSKPSRAKKKRRRRRG